MRTCETCGVKLPRWVPRKRNPSSGKLECDGCQNGRPGRPRSQAALHERPNKYDTTFMEHAEPKPMPKGHSDMRWHLIEDHGYARGDLNDMLKGRVKRTPTELHAHVHGGDTGGDFWADHSRDGSPIHHYHDTSKTGSLVMGVAKWVSTGALPWEGYWDGHQGHQIEMVSMSSGEKVQCETCKQVIAWFSEDRDEPLDYIPAGITYTAGLGPVIAHDSGDGKTIYHCPFCGAGQVVAGSDGTTECMYCHTFFTVQVQPEFSAFPQTVNGVPMQIPGMPGDPTNPSAPPGSPESTGPGADDGDGVFKPPDAPEPFAPPPAFKPPTQAAKVFMTATGGVLDEGAYMRHLAIRHADDREVILQELRAKAR